MYLYVKYVSYMCVYVYMIKKYIHLTKGSSNIKQHSLSKYRSLYSA